MYAQIAPLDPNGELQHEWLNSRAAIARFDRDAIEIRLMDVQECPLADMAVASLIVALVRSLAQAGNAAPELDEGRLAAILLSAMQAGEQAIIRDGEYLARLGVESGEISGKELWLKILESLATGAPELAAFGEWHALYRSQGSLASRITGSLDGGVPSTQGIRQSYRRLAACLADGRLFQLGSTA